MASKKRNRGKTYKRRRTTKRKPRKMMKKAMRASQNVIKYYARKHQPFPPRFKTKLTIFCQKILTAGYVTGSGSVPLNGLYTPFNIDPGAYWTGSSPSPGTNYPTAFHTFCGTSPVPYYNYRVYGSAVKMKVPQIDSRDCMEIAVIPSTNSTAISLRSFSTIAQQPDCKWITTSNARTNLLKHYATVHKCWGVTSRAVQDDLSGSFVGQYNTNPSRLAYWWFFIDSADAQALNNDVVLDIQITYYVEFFNPSYGLLQEN